MSISIDLPEKKTTSPKIAVIGVGGAGGNAVNNMINMKLEGVEFAVANTDAQALSNSICNNQIQLGETLTKGLGAGSFPSVGSQAAEESINEITSLIADSNMVFLTAGMGGGTGTGAAPVIAKIAREQGVLTVGVVTKPFHFEGSHRMRIAEEGLDELHQYIDTLIVIPNQNLFHKATEKTTFADAFKMVDNVLYSGIKGITDLMTMPGLINLDFADIRTIMGGMGKAMMGTGEGEGERRALDAAEAAIANPLLDNVSMKGANGVLINISGGLDMTLFEADEAAQRIKDEVDPDANIIFGSTFDSELEGRIRVSVVATGINQAGDAREKNTAAIATNLFTANRTIETENKEEPSRARANTFIPPEPAKFGEQTAQSSKKSDVTNVVEFESVNRKSAEIKEESSHKISSDIEFIETSRKNRHEITAEDLSRNYNTTQAANDIKEDSDDNIVQIDNKKETRPFKGIFKFFKDSNKVAEQEKNLATSFDEDEKIEESDLTISEDILNVPPFLRKKSGE
jgi:cell division protein FtsZ